jgi:leucyl aminopeptidase
MFVVSVSLSKSVPRDADAVIVGLTQVSGTPALVDLPSSLEKDLTKRWGTSPLAVALDLGAKTKSGSTVVLPTAGVRLVVVGLGDVDVTPEQVRRAVGNGVKALARLEPASPLHVVARSSRVRPRERCSARTRTPRSAASRRSFSAS